MFLYSYSRIPKNRNLGTWIPVIGLGLMLFVVLEFSHIALQTYIPQLKATIAEKTKNADTAELEQLLLRPEATNTEVPQAQP